MLKDIKFKEPYPNGWEGVYTNSLTKPRISFGGFTQEPSPHVIGATPRDIFHKSINEGIHQAMLPMLTIDLKSLTENYNETLPVLYYENTSIDWVLTKLDENGKVSEMMFYDYKGNDYDISLLLKKYKDERTYDDEIIYFEEGIEEIIDTLKYQKENHGNYHIVLDKEIPNDVDISNYQKYSDYVQAWWSDFIDNRRDEYKKYYRSDTLGPYPQPIQNGFVYPYLENNSSDFYFVTRVYAGSFGLCGFTYYIFYNPEEKIVAQFMQMT